MPECACGVAFAAHLEAIFGNQQNFEQFGGTSVPVYFCPGPPSQATGATPVAATFYTPVTALTPEQLANET